MEVALLGATVGRYFLHCVYPGKGQHSGHANQGQADLLSQRVLPWAQTVWPYNTPVGDSIRTSTWVYQLGCTSLGAQGAEALWLYMSMVGRQGARG